MAEGGGLLKGWSLSHPFPLCAETSVFIDVYEMAGHAPYPLMPPRI